MESSLIPQRSPGTMVEREAEELQSRSSSSLFSKDTSSSNSLGFSAAELGDDATSPESTQSGRGGKKEEPLFEMSSLVAHLPFKRGLSKHYHGKSQSFSSLSDVRCSQDLVKPERLPKKKMKTSRSCSGGFENQKSISPLIKSCSRARRTSKNSKSSFSSAIAGRRSSRPPIPPPRSGDGVCGRTLLFA